MSDLHAIADQIEAALEDADRACGTYSDDPYGWKQRHKIEMVDLTKRLIHAGIGCMLTEDHRGARFRCAGFASTSTSGAAGAIRNWLCKAREKAA